jgi:ABC-type multidrug transport system fused ATPase/permease subunit
MNQPIHGKTINKVLLKPRFKIKREETVEQIITKFDKAFNSVNQKYIKKIVDHHIVIDIPKEKEHFWSPQLHLEIEKDDEGITVIRGLFGPKPQIWTFFMFIHFAVAILFLVFAIMAYTKWSLKQNFTRALIMTITLPIFWIILYIFGQLGKKKGYQQMVEIDNYVNNILNK